MGPELISVPPIMVGAEIRKSGISSGLNSVVTVEPEETCHSQFCFYLNGAASMMVKRVKLNRCSGHNLTNHVKPFTVLRALLTVYQAPSYPQICAGLNR